MKYVVLDVIELNNFMIRSQMSGSKNLN